MKSKKLWYKIAIGIVAVILTLSTAIGYYLVDYAIGHKDTVAINIVPESTVTVESREVIDGNRDIIWQQTQEWLSQTDCEEAQIVSDDGLTLKGDIFWKDRGGHRWLIAVHGYTGRRSDMRGIAAFYGMRDYNVLTPDMRSHGESEGKFIGMGWLDRKDILRWLDYILELDPQAEIILHGISMGGGTVMMTAGEQLPLQVKGIVEDCGYTSVWDIFSDELSYLFHLPEFPILYISSGFSSLRAGYSFGEASAIEQVKKSTVPILFIHGSEDNFVHTEMVYELYDACASAKDLLIVEGAGHGESYSKDPDGYFDKVFSFLEEHCF